MLFLGAYEFVVVDVHFLEELSYLLFWHREVFMLQTLFQFV
jgi:hypothetical protein